MSTTTTTIKHPDGTVITCATTAAGAPAASAGGGAAKKKLVYFDKIGGRGEPIALVLRLAKQDFEYECFTLADFANPESDYHKRRASGEFTSFAQSGAGLPIYTEGAKKYFETNAILRMLGARYGFYSTDPETMWEIDVCMEKVELNFNHAGVGQHSHVCLANINQKMGNGDGPTEEQKDTCFKMYEELVVWGDQQLKKHGKPFLAGTASATIADFRFCVQFTDSIYNDLPSSVLGDEMKDKVKALIDTKPVFKKYILEIILPAIKDVRTEDMMW